nr:M28 family peptidase [uncultured Marinifilum sp.]
MNRTIIFFICIFISIQLSSQNLNITDLSKTISIDNIKKDLTELASAKMEGRETGKIGQKRAAKYIYKAFKQANITNLELTLDSLAYFQNFKVYKVLAPCAKIVFNNKTYKHYEHFMLSGFSDFHNKNLKIEFIGTAKDSSYLGKDFSDKAVLFVTRNLYAGAMKSNDIIKETGSKLIFFCNPENPHQIQNIIKRQQSVLSNRLKLNPDKFPTKNPFDSIKSPKHYSMYNNAKSTLQGPIDAEMAAEILQIKLKDLKKCAIKNINCDRASSDISIELKFAEQFLKIPTENVLACIPGKSKKNEFIVISAHYDHLGIKGDKIYYGANDNASGTAALIEIARKIKEAVDMGFKLDKSIVFAAFTGEEKGLLGSKYFVSTNTVPIHKIKANLNIDMLGRKDKNHTNNNSIYLLGTNDLNPKLKNISDSINRIYPHLNLDYKFDTPDNFLYSASDQASFVDQKIPAIFYFNGMHNDYHKTSDTADKINYESIKKVSSLIFLTALELAGEK